MCIHWSKRNWLHQSLQKSEKLQHMVPHCFISSSPVLSFVLMSLLKHACKAARQRCVFLLGIWNLTTYPTLICIHTRTYMLNDHIVVSTLKHLTSQNKTYISYAIPWILRTSMSSNFYLLQAKLCFFNF